MAKTSGSFKFRRGDILGKADAENDRLFLDTCYVDTGDVEKLADTLDPRCIVVGRTGSGKSALLQEVEKKCADSTVRINPESLSFNYISNSDTIRTLISLGVNLDPFFKLLWRHVLVTQIIALIHPQVEINEPQGWFAWLRNYFSERTAKDKEQKHRRVIEYLETYGDGSFWEDTGIRVKNIVCKFETEVANKLESKHGINASVGASGLKADATAGQTKDAQSREKLSTESIIENRHEFQAVVNQIQVRELDGILELLKEMLVECGRRVYVLIDKLDLQWTDESIRFRLLRALIDTAVAFTGIENAKIIMAMRVDLIERIYRDSRHEPGSQSEKIKDYYITLFWDRSSLIKLLDERVNRLVADRYAPNYRVELKDIVNPKIRKGRGKGEGTIDFILARTWKRPRDLIDFFNSCIERSDGKARISDDALIEAEGDYSRNRLRSLAEEWQLEYPYLLETAETLLSKRTSRFRLSELSDDTLVIWADRISQRPERDGDRLRPIAMQLNSTADFDACRVELAAVLYKVGVTGIQNDEEEKPQWASNLSYSLSPSEIQQGSYLYLHPGLWKALGVENRNHSSAV